MGRALNGTAPARPGTSVKRMTTTANNEPVRRRRSRQWWAGAAILFAVLLTVAVVWWMARPTPTPPPPAVSLEGLDAGVAQSIADAQRSLQKSPRSAEAWGRLGMVLAAHAFRPQAVQCFTEAERLAPGEPRWPYFRGVMLELGGAEADAIPAPASRRRSSVRTTRKPCVSASPTYW